MNVESIATSVPKIHQYSNARRVLRIPENNWQETDPHTPNQ
jgi:hypothetical protein